MNMIKERTDLGFDDDPLEDFNPAEWKPTAAKPTKKPKPEEAAIAAEASGFKSREPKPTPVVEAKPVVRSRAGGAPQRRRRTGRNAQFNLKAKPETIEAYCALADAKGWGLGETLEKAVKLLEREYQN